MQMKLAVLKEYFKMYLAIGFQETFKQKKTIQFSELVPALKIRVPVPERPLKKTTKKHALVHLPQVFN